MEEQNLNGNPIPDEELDMVAGGSGDESCEAFCPSCHRITPAIYSRVLHVYNCQRCGADHRIDVVMTSPIINCNW